MVMLTRRKLKKAIQFVWDISYHWPKSHNPMTVSVVLECLQPSANVLSDPMCGFFFFFFLADHHWSRSQLNTHCPLRVWRARLVCVQTVFSVENRRLQVI